MARARLLGSFLVLLALLFAAREARAEGDAQDFRQNCLSCHTIGGGKLVGPDLKDVTRDRPRDQLVRFIQSPKAVIDSGDPHALDLLARHNNVVMPTLAGMNAERAEALLVLIEEESAKETSQFATAGVSERPFTPQDRATGEAIFTGARALQNGGTACIACHRAGDVGRLGGGLLAPDLSDVLARLGGRKGLGAWLLNPPTPTMQPAFARHPLEGETEVLPILAFLTDVQEQHAAPDVAAQRLTYVLLGAGLAAAFLLLVDFAWRRRFRGVRAALLERNA